MEANESLGKYLRREREIRKISLREVADHTRVREHFLRAIEEDQFQLLPSATYIKGFLSNYANYVGLDPNDVIQRYETFLKGESVRHTEVLPEKKTLWKRKELLTIGGVMIVGLIALSFFFYLSKPAVESISVKPKTEDPLVPPPSPQIAVTTSAAEEEPLSLQIKAVEKTWVRIQVDSQPEMEVLFRPGEEISYQGIKQIVLLIGNAGGLDLVFNGRPLERFGKSGEVVTLNFTLQGVKTDRHEK